MKLTKRQIKPGIVVLEIEGRISPGNDCAQIDQAVQHHIERDEKRVILDLTGIKHIDSAVVGQIVKSHSSLRRSGGALRLAGVGPMVYGVLQMTMVDKVIEIYPTALDASHNF
jgi:anti-sigma B factor antagonist